MRTLLSTITVATPDLGEGSFVEFKLYEFKGPAKARNAPGDGEPLRLVARSSLDEPGAQASVMYGSHRKELEDVIIEYSRYDDHETFPSEIDWYGDDGL